MNKMNILIYILATLMLMTACNLDEETFTFVSGEDVAASGNYDQLVSGAYLTLLFPFEWGQLSRVGEL